MFRENEDVRKTIRDHMSSLINVINFDIIKILSIDHQHREIYESECIRKPSVYFDVTPFSFFNTGDLMQFLMEKKKAVILYYGQDDFEGTHIIKNDLRFDCEVYIPFLDSDAKTAGFVFFAKIEKSDTDINSNMDYLFAVRQLFYNIERILVLNKNAENLLETVLLLCEIVNAKQPHMIGNLYTVFFWAKKIAELMKLSKSEIKKLQLATLMHDLGKIYIDENILNKAEKYTAEEHEIMKSRVSYSYDIARKLSHIYDLDGIPDIILNYQERIDGTGYPNRVKGDRIPLLSKILCVAKSISLMLSNSLYRKAMPIEEIVNELKSNAGTRFDAEVVEKAILLLVYKRNQIEDHFTGLGNYATLSIVYGDNTTVNILGNIRKLRNYHQFRPIGALPPIDSNRLTGCSLYLNLDDRILKFKTEIKRISENTITLSKPASQFEEKTFSINWFIEGSILTKAETKFDVFIMLIGGDYLDFYVFNDHLTEQIDAGIISVYLSDNQVSLLPGVIIFQQRINDKVYFRFEYRGLSDTERKHIFSAVFHKQLEVKKLIIDTGLL